MSGAQGNVHFQFRRFAVLKWYENVGQCVCVNLTYTLLQRTDEAKSGYCRTQNLRMHMKDQ